MPAPDRAFVMLVGDHRDIREMYVSALVAAGYEVLEAIDGTDAIVETTAHLPDVVVADRRMPGLITTVVLCRYFTPLGVKVVVTSIGLIDDSEVAPPITALTPDALCAQVARLVHIRLVDRTRPTASYPPT